MARFTAIDMVGQRFGKLTVLSAESRTADRDTIWRCLCDCGKEKLSRGVVLRRGDCKSCGCLIVGRVTHGMSSSIEYISWSGMRSRCLNPQDKQYEEYKDRAPPERWESFENFYADMGPRPSSQHTLERVDNSKPYGPENCIWATKPQQSRNTKSNRLVTYQGKTQCLSAWAEELGIERHNLRNRLDRGWTVERAFTTS